MKKLFCIALFGMCLALTGCVHNTNDKSDDPTERGLSYVAEAIFCSAVIRAIFNK